MTRSIVGLNLGYWVLGCLACLPGGSESPRAPEGKPAPPVEAELSAAPPVAVESSAARATPPVGAPFAQASSSPEPAGPLACVQLTDPELDKESSWSKELGQMLERRLPRLRACTLDVPAEDEGQITLRLVYGKDGSPLSQHVVNSTSNACAASECLERELSSVKAPELLIDQAALDLTLRLKRDTVPERLSLRVDPLTPEEATVNAGGCVDEEIARLSQSKVREVVSTSYDQLQACYGQALMRDHSATGKVNFEFVIGRNGRVADAWVSDSTLRDCKAIDCMLTKFRALSFPEPVGRSVRVIYPINYVLQPTAVTLR